MRLARSSAHSEAQQPVEIIPGRSPRMRPATASSSTDVAEAVPEDLLPVPEASEHVFCVEGDGAFPICMLRHDQCWPAGRRDELAIAMSIDIDTPAPWRQVNLATRAQNAPSLRRWRSKGWRVII